MGPLFFGLLDESGVWSERAHDTSCAQKEWHQFLNDGEMYRFRRRNFELAHFLLGEDLLG